MKKPRVMASITKAIDLPSDVLLDMPKIYYDGIGTLKCENYKEILEYNSNCLRLRTKMGEIKVVGENIAIKEFICGMLTCRGDIVNIEFVRRK